MNEINLFFYYKNIKIYF